jgi:hypothetical protein
MKKIAKRLRKHQDLLLNYFAVNERVSNAVVKDFNLKAKLTMQFITACNSYTLTQ